MKKRSLIFFLLILLIPVLSAQTGIVRSSDYASLQAAFDAVPESGGIVYIAPGTYELSEPLVLRRENVRIEGAGPSTHIVNKDETGKPALLVRPDGYKTTPRKDSGGYR